jgi:hypothetical protein
MQFSFFYPGNEYLDILALDVYGSDFNQNYYDSLVALSNGKPIVLGEVGNPPTLEILDNQPKWTYYVTWAGMVRNTLKKQYDILMNDPRILSQEDSMYRKIIAPYRLACGLPPLQLNPHSSSKFNGTWIFNEDKSQLDHYGASNIPFKLDIVMDRNELKIQRTNILEYADNKISEEVLKTDGSENVSEFWNLPKITIAQVSKDGDTLWINSKVTIAWDEKTIEMLTKEVWTLDEQGKELHISQYSKSLWGEQTITMVFKKEDMCLNYEGFLVK